MNLEGKTALVTGASRGIGRAIALELAKKGADVLLNYNGSVDRAREVKAEIERLGKSAQLYPCDVADYSACETMFRDIFSEHSGLDILVNNAGITESNASSDIRISSPSLVIPALFTRDSVPELLYRISDRGHRPHPCDHHSSFHISSSATSPFRRPHAKPAR